MAETKKKQKMSFEQSLARLEEIVGALERGDAPLEEALALFEEGATLMKQCGQTLAKAEQKVALIVKGADGTPEKKPFAAEPETGGENGAQQTIPIL